MSEFIVMPCLLDSILILYASILFAVFFAAMFFAFCVWVCVCLCGGGYFTIYNGLKHDAKALCSITKHRKAVMYLAEKISICVLDNLHSGMSFSAVAIQC